MDATTLLEELSVVLQPLGDRVAVLPDEQDEVSAGGIIIPDTTEKEPKQVGTVLATGTGGLWEHCPNPSDFVVPGDRVLFGKFTGDDLKIKKKDGTEVKIKVLHLDGILAGCNPKP